MKINKINVKTFIIIILILIVIGLLSTTIVVALKDNSLKADNGEDDNMGVPQTTSWISEFITDLNENHLATANYDLDGKSQPLTLWNSEYFQKLPNQTAQAWLNAFSGSIPFTLGLEFSGGFAFPDTVNPNNIKFKLLEKVNSIFYVYSITIPDLTFYGNAGAKTDKWFTIHSSITFGAVISCSIRNEARNKMHILYFPN